MNRYQIRLEDVERHFWQNYANRYFRGNLAKMIRTFVTHAILSGDLEKDSELPDEIVDAINDIKSNSKLTTETVGSFQSDLVILKSLLSQIINSQVMVVNNRSENVTVKSTEIELKEIMRNYLEEQENYVVQLRSRLLSSELPLPLRMKSYFSPKWRLDSGWYQWPL